MDFQEFPKWKYDGLEGILVENAAEETALGAGYTDAPVDPADLVEKKAKAK